MKTFTIWLVSIFLIPHLFGQSCGGLNLREVGDIQSNCNEITMTMVPDANDRPFLYVASKEGGLKVFDVSDPTEANLVSRIETSNFNNLHVMNVSQTENYLYIAIGSHFTDAQEGGMAIVDVESPQLPKITDVYYIEGSDSGAGIVKVEDNVAYLGGMKSGMILLDVSDKSNIKKLSSFVPDNNFPVNSPNANLYNARGLAIRDKIVYLCYDAGGLRIIDCSNPSEPVEIGRFSNPALHVPFNLPRAYNNVVLDGNYVYVAVDYCGLEVLEITDPEDIKLSGWWNPLNCPNNNWFASSVHANELFYNQECQRLFVSTGKSDMIVLNMEDPENPDSCNIFGGNENGLGTWGVAGDDDYIFLSYICTLLPFVSTKTGVKIIKYESCVVPAREISVIREGYKIFPNPAGNLINIEFEEYPEILSLKLLNVNGSEMNFHATATATSIQLYNGALMNGLYVIVIQTSQGQITEKVLILN